MKLVNILHENYGGPGEYILPASHQAGMKVTKGGSMCANCEYSVEGSNKYWKKWAETEQVPHPGDEYCCDWWHAK
jgi:ferredoxin